MEGVTTKNYPIGATKKQIQVKNKLPAAVQITAEQLLREAVDRQLIDAAATKPQQRIIDEEELNEYRLNKRKEYEDILRRQRHHIGTWIKYAQWEAAQREFKRARSVFERALLVDYTNVSLWLKYIEMETTNKFFSSARNLYNRVCQLLPREEQLWLKYAHLEELLGNYAGARAVYERWVEWNPSDKGWLVYIHFEERCREIERARRIFERYLSNRPSQESFLRFCKFEERLKNIPRARAGYEKAIELLPEEMLNEQFYLKFAAFEERQREQARAKAIYEAALQRVPRGAAEELYLKYVAFQKQFGDREGLEETVLSRRRFVYEEALHTNPLNYDAWIDYIRLEETNKNKNKIRNIYERAVANVPPINEKRYWTRYIYIWISYALYEELEAKDMDRCRAVYEKAIEIIPHKLFSFAKIWTLFVAFEIRQLNLDRARKIFGAAIAKCGKEKIYKNYGQLELRLGNIDRCRQIYAKFIETYPLNPKIWKTYIDMEVNWGAFERARQLYERLLDKTQHINAFKGYATFEWKKAEQKDRARQKQQLAGVYTQVLNRGLDVCKANGWDEDRAALLEHWLALEREAGDAKSIQRVFRLLPKKIKKRKTQKNANGVEEVTETLTYVFPDDEGSAANLKILQAAKMWKKRQLEAQK